MITLLRIALASMIVAGTYGSIDRFNKTKKGTMLAFERGALSDVAEFQLNRELSNIPVSLPELKGPFPGDKQEFTFSFLQPGQLVALFTRGTPPYTWWRSPQPASYFRNEENPRQKQIRSQGPMLIPGFGKTTFISFKMGKACLVNRPVVEEEIKTC